MRLSHVSRPTFIFGVRMRVKRNVVDIMLYASRNHAHYHAPKVTTCYAKRDAADRPNEF